MEATDPMPPEDTLATSCSACNTVMIGVCFR